MDIEVIEMAERKAKFILKNSSPAMANALRRTMLTDIPKMAIDTVEIHLGSMDWDGNEYESATPLFDEVLAHRLGMIPVPTDYNLFIPQSECSCGGEGCPSCTITYSLNKHGPATVLSGDMMPLGDMSLKVKDENIPVVELTKNQAVMIYAKAVMGTARKHVKWQAAFGVGYKYRPIITIDPDMAGEPETLRLATMYPKVFGEKDGKLVVIDADQCDLAVNYSEISEGAVTVSSDDKNFVFTFETDGSLTARQVLDKAVSLLSEEAADLAAQVEAL